MASNYNVTLNSKLCLERALAVRYNVLMETLQYFPFHIVPQGMVSLQKAAERRRKRRKSKHFDFVAFDLRRVCVRVAFALA